MYKLIELDNKTSVGQREVGVVSEFSFYGVCFYFGAIQSSRVESIICKDKSTMVVKTKNSTYTFRKEM